MMIRIFETSKTVEKYPMWTNVSYVINIFPAVYRTLLSYFLTYLLTYLLRGAEPFLRS